MKNCRVELQSESEEDPKSDPEEESKMPTESEENHKI